MVAVISHLQFDMIAHSLNNRREKTLSGRNLLKQYLPFDVATFVDKVIDSEGADKPRSDITALKVVRILNVVTEIAVALNADLKQVLNGMPPIMESALGNDTFVQIIERAVLRPLAVNVRA